MSLNDAFDRILACLHDAMLDDARWPAASAMIDEACGMKGSALVVGKGRSQEDGQIFLSRFCYYGKRHPERERWYFDLYYPSDERVPRVAQLPDSRLVRITDLYTDEELKRSPAYNEALPRGGYQNGLNVRLDGPDGSSIVWTIADSSASIGWDSGQIELIQRLLPHLRQFVRVRWALESSEALGATLTDLLHNTRVGIVHLDRRGRIVAANERAEDVLRQGDGLFAEGGFLRARLAADDARLQKLVEGVLPTFGGPAGGGSMAVRRHPGTQRSIMHLTPVSERYKEFGLGSVAALALVVDPANRPRVDPVLVASLLDLTPAQSQVAALLSEGMSVNEVAASTGRQANAVYFLLKQIYKRQGISRQAELVQLVMSAAELQSPRR